MPQLTTKKKKKLFFYEQFPQSTFRNLFTGLKNEKLETEG